jgi:hypothetical protein
MITLRPFEQDRFNRLVELARNRFDAALTQPEARVLIHSAGARHLDGNSPGGVTVQAPPSGYPLDISHCIS